MAWLNVASLVLGIGCSSREGESSGQAMGGAGEAGPSGGVDGIAPGGSGVRSTAAGTASGGNGAAGTSAPSSGAMASGGDRSSTGGAAKGGSGTLGATTALGGSNSGGSSTASGGKSSAGGTVGSGGVTQSGGAASGGSTAVAPTKFANPIIRYDAADPTNGPGSQIFTADGAAMVWNNKVYLYTGHDEQVEGGSGYKMFDWRLFTSSDMTHWENKGAVMRYNVFGWARGSSSGSGNANAGQVVQRNDKNGVPKFYFYVPVEGGQSEYGISIGVAVADAPEGPFKDARGIALISFPDTSRFSATHGWRNLDPTVFVDTDGKAYMYWGNGILYFVQLEEDMIHLKGETYTTDASGNMQNRSINGVTIAEMPKPNNYTEAPWLSKRGSTYYLSYAAGFPESIAYATSSSPSGPWTYRGVILDRVTNSDTVHQSIFDFNGASYMSYHNGALPTGGPYRRSTCMDRLYYDADGTIAKVVQTK
ncbi:MAG: family 43 glycosylhydrolase [Polyangiaceae bacterium]